MKNYTSIEQSKKLLELGIDPLTSDMCYKTEDVDYAETEDDYVLDLVCRPYSEYLKFVGPMGLAYKAIPCWSVGALMELMPMVNGREPHLIWTKGTYTCFYYRGHSTTKETIIDACYEMMIWLLENDYIKK